MLGGEKVPLKGGSMMTLFIMKNIIAPTNNSPKLTSNIIAQDGIAAGST